MKKKIYMFVVSLLIIFIVLSPRGANPIYSDVLDFTRQTYDSILYNNTNTGIFKFNLKRYGIISKKVQQKLINDVWDLTNNYYFEFGNKVYITKVEVSQKEFILNISNAYPKSDQKIAEILSKTIKSDMSILDVQKNIVKYLVQNFKYDYSNINKGDINKAFETKRALCEMYSSIYFRCMRELGIPVRIVVNKDHAWNMTKIEGNWYHTDITYIASAKDVKSFLNVSTEEILKTRLYNVNNYPLSSHFNLTN